MFAPARIFRKGPAATAGRSLENNLGKEDLWTNNPCKDGRKDKTTIISMGLPVETSQYQKVTGTPVYMPCLCIATV